MATLSSFIAHDLTTTGSTQILGADQAQYLAPLETPVFKNGLTVNGVGGTQPSISLTKNMVQKFYIIADEDLGQSHLVTSYPLLINAPSITLPSEITLGGGIVRNVKTKNASYECTLSDDVIYVVNDDVAITFGVDTQLNGKCFTIIVGSYGGVTINGSPTISITVYKYMYLQDDASWWAI